MKMEKMKNTKDKARGPPLQAVRTGPRPPGSLKKYNKEQQIVKCFLLKRTKRKPQVLMVLIDGL